MAKVKIDKVLHSDKDVSTVIGSVDGIDTSAQVWQSAIDQLPDLESKLEFCARALVATLPVKLTLDEEIVGVVDIN